MSLCKLYTMEVLFMKDFPDFMKNALNHIDSSQQNTPDIDGYYFEGKDGSQIAYWTLLFRQGFKGKCA